MKHRLHGQRRRRRPVWTAVGAAGATLAVAGCVAVFVRNGDTEPAGDATAAKREVARTVDAASRTHVVAPGERVDLGRRGTFWLEAGGAVVVSPDGPDTRPIRLSKQKLAKGSAVALAVEGQKGEIFGIGVYRGAEAPDKVRVKVGGKFRTAQIITLGGSPDWTAFYVVGPRGKPSSPSIAPKIVGKLELPSLVPETTGEPSPLAEKSSQEPTLQTAGRLLDVTVSGADGTVLARSRYGAKT